MKGHVSMRTIIMEIRRKEIENNKRFKELESKKYKLNKLEQVEYDKYEKRYDEGNYYRKLLRYAQNIFQHNTQMVKVNEEEYFIPEDKRWSVEIVLQEYMSPYLKITRTKPNSQVPFSEFNNFISVVEEKIKLEINDDVEVKKQLAVLNLFTNYTMRRILHQMKDDIEDTISKDLTMVHELDNTQLKISLLESYHLSIKNFSNRWRNEIRLHIDVEEETVNEMIDEELSRNEKSYPIDEALEMDFKDINLTLIEEDDDIPLTQILTEEERTSIEEKRKEFESFLRNEKK